MRIALLNLPLDNNYGGNLQRYALVKVIQGLGHDINHIFLTRYRHLKWYKKPFAYGKRFFMRYVLRHKDVIIFSELHFNKKPNKVNESVLEFYMKHIPHTIEVKSLKEIKTVCNQYDCFLVGSDQVWRKKMTMQIGLYSYFFSFLGRRKVKRIAYGVSMGTEENELSDKEIKHLSKLYKQFNAVSVRELFMLEHFEQYGWENPRAEIVIDPTMLLDVSEYRLLFDSKNASNDKQTENKIYCYILDESPSTDSFIKEMSAKMKKDFQKTSLNKSQSVSIEQWLNNIFYADLVITDSYHGTVFSILFNKKFIFIGNNMRGNARISSLFSLLGIDNNDTMNLDWNSINHRIENHRQSSIDFLKKSLS